MWRESHRKWREEKPPIHSSAILQLYVVRISGRVLESVPNTLACVSGKQVNPGNSDTEPFLPTTTGYVNKWPGKSTTWSWENKAHNSSARRFTFRMHAKLQGCRKTSSRKPQCSNHSDIRNPWIWPCAGACAARWCGWYAPIAISVSRAPSMDLWLMLADPMMTYSSSTANVQQFLVVTKDKSCD